MALIEVTAAAVLLMMNDADAALAKGKHVPPPWASTYASTADAVARAANRAPFFKGDDGPAKTAAWVVSVMRFESGFRQDAAGDAPCLARDEAGKCTRKGEPTSFCAMQVSSGNFAALGITREQIQSSIDVCVDAGMRMMKMSMRVCTGEPTERLLDHYAAGGDKCIAPRGDEGAHRVRLGQALYRKHLARLVVASGS